VVETRDAEVTLRCT